MTEHIDPEAVNAAFLACLYRSKELVDGYSPDDAIRVRSVRPAIFHFHPGRVESHRAQVQEWLALLPLPFRKSAGGGWSFLNACNESGGYQWTGLHERVDQLFCLAIALGLARWLMEPEDWHMLPGGMPYVQIEVTG